MKLLEPFLINRLLVRSLNPQHIILFRSLPRFAISLHIHHLHHLLRPVLLDRLLSFFIILSLLF